jgi:predicted O-methyltransferase YrrM
MKPIHLRNVPPPEETFDHSSFIENLASYIRPENYLELGVRCGKTFKKVSPLCSKATGVDIANPQFVIPNNSVYLETTTDEFFEKISPDEKYDLIFIDADHSHEQSLKDFLNAEKHLIDDGFIILHDTYPFDSYLFKPELCNDCYKTALYIKQNLYTRFEILTLPFNPGLTLVKKMPQNKQLIYL